MWQQDSEVHVCMYEDLAMGKGKLSVMTTKPTGKGRNHIKVASSNPCLKVLCDVHLIKKKRAMHLTRTKKLALKIGTYSFTVLPFFIRMGHYWVSRNSTASVFLQCLRGEIDLAVFEAKRNLRHHVLCQEDKKIKGTDGEMTFCVACFVWEVMHQRRVSDTGQPFVCINGREIVVIQRAV